MGAGVAGMSLTGSIPKSLRSRWRRPDAGATEICSKDALGKEKLQPHQQVVSAGYLLGKQIWALLGTLHPGNAADDAAASHLDCIQLWLCSKLAITQAGIAL